MHANEYGPTDDPDTPPRLPYPGRRPLISWQSVAVMVLLVLGLALAGC